MSVINQMLRDLDARHASSQERASLPAQLRTLPPLRKARLSSWHLLAVGMVAGILVAWLANLLIAPNSAPPPAVAAQPVPAAAVVATAPVEAGKTATQKTEIQNARTPGKVGDMKIATSISSPKAVQPAVSTTKPDASTPASHAPVATKTASTVTEPRKERAANAVPPAASPVSEPVTPAQIDKRTKGGQGREIAEAEYRKGMQAIKNGDSVAAQQSLRRALELDTGFAKARQALLSVLVNGKQWAEAQQLVQDGLALDPARSEWALILARLQFEQGNATAAIETLGRHAAHAGTDADYQGLFAYLLQKQQRPVEAAERFQAALALRPQEGRWWFGLGLAQESAGKRGEAKEAYAKAREIGNLPPDMAQVVEQKLR